MRTSDAELKWTFIAELPSSSWPSDTSSAKAVRSIHTIGKALAFGLVEVAEPAIPWRTP